MRIAKLPPAAGRRWVFEGFALLRRRPLALLGLVVLCMLLLGLSSVIPFGPLLWAMATPLLLVGLMHAVRAVDQGGTPAPQMLLAGVRDDGGRAVKPLLLLGVANVLASAVVLAVVSLLLGGLPPEAPPPTTPSPSVPTPPDPSILLGPLVFLALYTPVQMALWYAPLFVAWHGIAPRKAMFFSFVATWRNRWTFVQFALTWFGVALAVSVAGWLLQQVFGEDSRLLAFFVLSPLSLLMTGALICSLWPTYRDAVLPDEPGEPPLLQEGPASDTAG